MRADETIIHPIGVLIKQFLSKDRGCVIASRDYHPHDHAMEKKKSRHKKRKHTQKMIQYSGWVYIDCFFYGFWMLESEFEKYKVHDQEHTSRVK